MTTATPVAVIVLLYVRLHKGLLVKAAHAIRIAVPNFDIGWSFAAKLGIKDFVVSLKAEKAAF